MELTFEPEDTSAVSVCYTWGKIVQNGRKGPPRWRYSHKSNLLLLSISNCETNNYLEEGILAHKKIIEKHQVSKSRNLTTTKTKEENKFSRIIDLLSSDAICHVRIQKTYIHYSLNFIWSISTASCIAKTVPCTKKKFNECLMWCNLLGCDF